MSITRPAAMTPEEIEKILRAVADRGATIQVNEPNLTAVKNWILSAIGIAVIDRNTLAIQECTARVDAAQRQLADMDSELIEISARLKALADASAP